MRSRIESFAKYAGIATVSVEWLALLLYYLQMPSYFGGKYPISHFATLPQTQFVFTICYTLAGIFFWIFMRHHVHKYYRIPSKIVCLSMILFIALAIVPYHPDETWSVIVHNLLGWISAVFFLIGIFLMARNAHDKHIYRASLLAIIASCLLITAFANIPKDSHLIFALEAGAWLVWQIWVLWITYYSYNHHLMKNT